jgi:hypothetical protein
MKKPKLCDRLAAAENDLAAATAAANAIAAREGDAAETAASFAAWQAEMAAAENEKKRLTFLVAKLKADIEAEAQKAAEAAQAKLEADAEREADRVGGEVKRFFETFGPQALGLLRAIANADILVEQANRGRQAAGQPPIDGPESRARLPVGRAAEIVSERTVSRWVYQRTGCIIDQDTAKNIVSSDGMTGSIRSNATMVTYGGSNRVERRAFREVIRRPAQRARLPDPLAMTLTLPALTGDRPLWEPPRYYSPSSVIEKLDALENKKPADADTEVEYVPLPPDEAAA